MNDKLLGKIHEAASMLDKSAALGNGQTGKQSLGFRVDVLKKAAQHPMTRVVIADPLALFATLHPEKVTQSVVGDVEVGSFVDVKPSTTGRALNYGPIAGEPGPRRNAAERRTRIGEIDEFLTRTVLGVSPEPLQNAPEQAAE